MGKLLLVGLMIGMFATSATAQTNCQTYGNQTKCNGANGYNSNSQTYGNQTYIHENGPNGQQRNTTCQRFGNQTYCN